MARDANNICKTGNSTISPLQRLHPAQATAVQFAISLLLPSM
jgi:hypothetical protein